MSERSEQEEDLFYEALSRADPAKRVAFLDRTCAGRPVLRAHVEALLTVQAEAEGFFAEAELATRLQIEANQIQ